MKRSYLSLSLLILVGASSGVACGDNEPDRSLSVVGDGDGDGDVGDGDIGDGDGDIGDGDGDMLTCADNQGVCGGVCTSLLSDNLNCGSCGTQCGAGETCVSGECTESDCETGLAECGTQCVDLQTSEEFCGACDTSCGAGELCENGQCQVACPADFLLCDGECIDPSKDRDYCGASSCDDGGGMGGAGSTSTQCASGEVCSNGQCQLECGASQISCDDLCVNPQTDVEYCGATTCVDAATSGDACELDEICNAGQCELDCSASELACGGACVDPTTSVEYCGATDCSDAATSGVACRPGQECVAGFCENLVPQWEPPVVISDTATDTGTNPIEMATDSSGNAIVLWRQFLDAGNTELRLFSSRYDAATRTWSDPLRVDDGTERVAAPAIAVSPSGSAMAIWVDQGGAGTLRMARYNVETGIWSASARVDSGSGAVLSVAVAMDGADDGYITWRQQVMGDQKEVPRVFTAIWDASTSSLSAPTQLAGYGEYDCAPSDSPKIAANASGDVFIQWRDVQIRKSTDPSCVPGADPICDCADITSNDWNLHQARFDSSGGTWVITELAPGTFPRESHDISVDGSGNAYSIWSSWNADTGVGDGFAAKYTDGGNWGSPAKVINQGEYVRWVDIDTNSSGTSVIGYQLQSLAGTDPITVRGTVLSTDLVPSQDTSLASGIAANAAPLPGAAIGADGSAFVIWRTGSTVIGARYDSGTTTWQNAAALSSGDSAVASWRVRPAADSFFSVWHEAVGGISGALFTEYR